MIRKYKEYNSSGIYENLSAAKEYIIKKKTSKEIEKYKEQKAKELADSGEELEDPKEIKIPKGFIDKIVSQAEIDLKSDSKFTTLRDEINRAGFPNYALPFTRFVYDQGLATVSLRTLLQTLADNKDILSKLPKTVDQYSKIPKESEIPGHEMLIDDINKLKQKEMLSKFYKKLDAVAKNAQKAYEQGKDLTKPVDFEWIEKLKKSPQQKLENPLSIINSKKGVKGLEELASMAVTWMTRNKPIETYIEQIENAANADGESVLDIIEKVKKAGESSSSIIYNADGFLVLSIRSEEAQKNICAIATKLCLNTGSFWTYGKGNVIYEVFNFNKKYSSPNFFSAITVYPNGKTKEVKDKNNQDIDGIDFNGKKMEEPFKHMGIPEDGVKEITQSLEPELRIKKLTDDVFGNIKASGISSSWRSFLEKTNMNASLISSGIEKSGLTQKQFKSVYWVCMDLLKGYYRENAKPNDPLTPETAIEFFMETGIYTPFSLEGFKNLSEGKATPEQKERIKKTTLDWINEEGPALIEFAKQEEDFEELVRENDALKVAMFCLENKGEIEKLVSTL
jgi:hypothetical protein